MADRIRTSCLASILVAGFGVSGLGQVTNVKNENWNLRLENRNKVFCDTCSAAPQFLAGSHMNRSDVIRFSIPSLRSVSFMKVFGSKAIISGFANRELEMMIIHDLNGNKTMDVINGTNFSPSPTGRFIAFQNFFSWDDDRFLASDVILLYDAAWPPDQNRVQKYHDLVNASDAGVPVFPRINREKQEPSPLKNHDLSVDNIVWSASGNTLGFIAEAVSPPSRMRKGYRTASVIFGAVDVSGGLARMRVYVKTLPIRELLRPEQSSAAVRFAADAVSINDKGILECYSKSVWQQKTKFVVNVFKNYDEMY